MTSRRWLCSVAAAAVLIAGCSGGDDAPPEEETLPPSTTDESVPVTAPPPLEPAPRGRGVLSIGGIRRRFDVTRCRVMPAPEGPGAYAPFLLVGLGRTPAGVAFRVEVQRYVSGDDPPTVTDLVNYEDSARILQSQRVDVGGVITDLRDPDADDRFLRLVDGRASGRGIAGPPGSREGDEGLVGIALAAACT